MLTLIVTGTEYFDGKTSRYVDYPLTDVSAPVCLGGVEGMRRNE